MMSAAPPALAELGRATRAGRRAGGVLRRSGVPASRFESLILKNAEENHFTAKQQRAQRTYIKNKIHLFGEVLDHTKLNSKPCLSFVSLRLCVGNLNSYCRV